MSTYRKQLADLYEPEHLATRNEHGTNAGLWLDKYIKNQHQDDTNSRSGLVKEVAVLTVPEMYRQFYKRWEETLTKASARQFKATTRGRMIIGLGDESVLEASIALHHTYGVPYIPGSALKGLAASYARQRLGEKWVKGSDAYKVIFGDTDEAGYVTFFDALLCADVDKSDERVLYQDIITVHHPDYYQESKENAAPSDWDSPTPIPFLSATGTYLIALAAPDLKNGQRWINTTVAILRHALKERGIGAKTSSGYGRMDLEESAEDEREEAEEVIPEKASISLLRKIANAPQITFELYAAWEQLPPDDEEGRIEGAEELVKKMDSTGGKKRSEKWEKRYQMLKKFLAENTKP
jgi:CRISPR-associated protein Cmr6